MRWKAFTPCPKKSCGGQLEYWEDEPIEKTLEDGSKFKKPQYRFICTVCDYTGNWAQFARQRLGRSGTWKSR